MNHKLKTWQEYIPDLKSGLKTFEVRENDRVFCVGDTLMLEGWNYNKQEYTGSFVEAKVTYILNGGQFGVKSGYVVMGISVINFDLKPKLEN